MVFFLTDERRPPPMLRPNFLAPFLTSVALLGIAVCTLLVGPSACGGNCSHKDSTVAVVFPGSVAPADIATFLATGACGPAPGAGGGAGGSAPDGTATQDEWGLSVPTLAAGTCMIHVGLTNGQIFATDVTVKSSSDCGGFTFVDAPVYVTFASGSEAGAGD
jgi:hypothetical protein